MIADKAQALAKLREPFKPNQISKLPKPYRKDSEKGNCKECGGYHGLPAMHLDYVGHAALTDRLLDVDPFWSWEPMSLGEDGLPKLDAQGGLWIKLTICGVTRIGYGDAEGKTGPSATKERIGDALRNAAMRFGAALDLWHKGVLHDDEPESIPAEELQRMIAAIEGATKMGEMKAALAAAEARCGDDADALAKVRFAAEAKAAKARTSTEVTA